MAPKLLLLEPIRSGEDVTTAKALTLFSARTQTLGKGGNNRHGPLNDVEIRKGRRR
jgi:hypothetical protein